jgi:hypothetical protein
MRSASKLIGLVCVMLAVALWAVTIMTDRTPGSMTAAAVLTVIVALMIVLTVWE